MTNNKLSEIEIKLINASKKFAEEQNKKIGGDFTYFVEMREESGRKKSWISIQCPYKKGYSAIICVHYEGNADSGEISIGRLKSDENIIKLKNIYKDFLIKEIPEIKDRIWCEEYS